MDARAIRRSPKSLSKNSLEDSRCSREKSPWRGERGSKQPMSWRAGEMRASRPCWRENWLVRERVDYIREPAAIYRRSFDIIRSEADLSGFSDEEADVAVRMIHACGLVEAAQQIMFGPGLVPA